MICLLLDNQPLLFFEKNVLCKNYVFVPLKKSLILPQVNDHALSLIKKS